MNRKQYYQVVLKKGGSLAQVELFLIRKTVENYWGKLFPGQEFRAEIVLHPNQKLEIIAELPHLSEEEGLALLSKIEDEVGGLLQAQLGYNQEFLLTVLVR